MPKPRGTSLRQRRDLRWFLVILGFFAYLLLLTRERMEVKERASRIEILERSLQELKTDVALRNVALERLTGFPEVREMAERIGMRAADDGQRFLLATVQRPDPQETSRDPLQVVANWFTQGISGGVAEAMPSATGTGDVEGSR